MIKVNEKRIEWHAGMTIKSVITLIGYTECYHPALIVSLDGEHVTFKKFSETSVADGAEVKIFKAVGAG